MAQRLTELLDKVKGIEVVKNALEKIESLQEQQRESKEKMQGKIDQAIADLKETIVSFIKSSPAASSVASSLGLNAMLGIEGATSEE